MTVTMKDIPTIRDNLKKCKPIDMANKSDKPLTNREVIAQLAPTLLKMRERGFTTSALVELLQEHNITIKGRDLSRYLRAVRNPKSTENKCVRPQK